MLLLVAPTLGFRVIKNFRPIRRVHSTPPISWISSKRFLTPKSSHSEEDTDTNADTLEWESFDFSETPKWDPRFQPEGKTINNIFDKIDEKTMQEEADQDVLLAKKQKEHREALHSLSPDIVQNAIRILKPYVQEQRYDRITQVLQQRTRNTQFLFENPSNPSNVWACLRTMDSFGIQHVHIVTDSKLYEGKAALLQKQGMRTAMGSAQWLTIHHYISTEEAVQALRNSHNCRILASDLNPSSVDIRDIDWATAGSSSCSNEHGDKDRPLCIVMGNELKGISDTMRDLADLTFTLPMVGFAESFNLSVATAITLAHLSAASSHKTTGPLRPGDLPEEEFRALVLRGMIHSISQKKVTQALLKKEGIILPDSLYQKGINLGKKLKENEVVQQ
jgi:tRNA (guanosine-2'-O-)-methyltransferase